MSTSGFPAAGFWPATLSAEQAASATADFVELKAGPAGVFWTCYQPDSGCTRLWWASVGGKPECLTPPGFSVRSRVNEYGGGSFAIADDFLVFVNEPDQQIYVQELHTAARQPRQLTSQADCRYADMDISPCGRYLVAVAEQHGPAAVIHRIVNVTLEGGACSEPGTVQQGSDFYSSPRLSGNGQRLLWIGWSRPHQPWTQTQLYCSESDGQGGWYKPVVLAGAAGNAAIQQPRFDREHRVMALNDQSGFWQPWREQAGRLQRVPGIAADHAGAAWQMGGCNFLPLDGRYCLVSWFEQGFGKLGLYDMEADKLVCSYLPGYSRMRHLAMDSEYFYCIASHPLQGTAVIALERASGVAIVLAQLPTGSVPGQLSSPQALEFVAGAGQLAQAFFYPPCNDRYQLSARERPPLVIFLHGGPTSAAYPVFDARIQFWTQRGFAVADLNYRGSTGFGRAYRQALAGRWGELDVVDVLALVDELVTRDWVDARRVCVRGSSAGGYTSLLALAGNQRFAAAASWYGVTDPLRLEQVTHKFESDYLGWLLGPEVLAGRSLARCRSPLEVADRMHTPVIFFQGGQDVVVVPEQTRSLVRKLRGQGVPVEYHEFPEQGHGFRSAGRLAFALQKELEFYRQQFLLQQHSDSCGGPRGRSLT